MSNKLRFGLVLVCFTLSFIDLLGRTRGRNEEMMHRGKPGRGEGLVLQVVVRRRCVDVTQILHSVHRILERGGNKYIYLGIHNLYSRRIIQI